MYRKCLENVKNALSYHIVSFVNNVNGYRKKYHKKKVIYFYRQE